MAEVVAGELARAIGLPVPELAVVEVAPALGLAEPDPEIQDLIVGSPGENLGMDFLPGALPMAVPSDPAVDADLAADVVWFDALVTNVDRTPRNPNLLVWHGRPVSDRPRRGFLPPARRAPACRDGARRRADARRARAAARGRLARGGGRTAGRARARRDRHGGRRSRPTRGSARIRPPGARTSPASCASASRRRGRSWRSSSVAEMSFSYAVLRVVPSVERGEAINVGVVVYSRQHDFLGLRVQLDDARLAAHRARLRPGADPRAARRLRPGRVRRCGRRRRWRNCPRPIASAG